VKKSGLDSAVDVTSYVAEVASRLSGRVVALSSALRQSLEDQIPELRGDAALVELLGTSVEGNVDTVLHALRYDIAVERVEAPTAALEYARRLAQRGVPVNALVRAYRLGQRQINEAVFAELRDIDIPEPMRVGVIEAITGTLFEYIDWMSQQVVAVYEDERERWLENQNSLRALRVREVLTANRLVDADAASTVSAIRCDGTIWGSSCGIRTRALMATNLAGCNDFSASWAKRPALLATRSSLPLTEAADGVGCRIAPRWPTFRSRSASSRSNDRIPRVWQSGPWPMVSRVFASPTARRRLLAASQ